MTSIELVNNPFMFNSDSGDSFVMVVNPCTTAKSVGDQQMLERGIEDVTYSNESCDAL